MARVNVQQTDVLERIVLRLRDQLSLNDRQCYETLEPLAPPVIPKGGEWFVSVSPGEGEFVPGEQVPANITEQWHVIVTAYTRIKLDPTDHDAKLLRDASRGLLTIKRSVLKAIVGHDLTTGSVDSPDDTFLRNLLYASRSHKPNYDVEKQIGWIAIEVVVDFDWDLS
tara:strand:- start:5938 stop:6441 length:504 start_codon:yes stop_codon:yes gene_type:complete